MATETNEKPRVWVGLRPCGCCVAVVVDRGERAADVNSSKRDMLDEGLSVVGASWADWISIYLPSMQGECSHV